MLNKQRIKHLYLMLKRISDPLNSYNTLEKNNVIFDLKDYLLEQTDEDYFLNFDYSKILTDNRDEFIVKLKSLL